MRDKSMYIHAREYNVNAFLKQHFLYFLYFVSGFGGGRVVFSYFYIHLDPRQPP